MPQICTYFSYCTGFRSLYWKTLQFISVSCFNQINWHLMPNFYLMPKLTDHLVTTQKCFTKRKSDKRKRKKEKWDEVNVACCVVLVPSNESLETLKPFFWGSLYLFWGFLCLNETSFNADITVTPKCTAPTKQFDCCLCERHKSKSIWYIR